MSRCALISPLSVAPMIDWTYSAFRVLMRLIAPQALLYTEMQSPGAIKNNPTKAIFYEPIEHPIALQLGGSNKEELVYCAQLAEQLGFDEVNLNLGCPSDRVQAGRFGACLMAAPDLVAECITAMKNAVKIPITAKTRIGIDDFESYAFFANFVHRLKEAGCDKFIVHARKAWLTGLSPKQNRTIPPLHYEYAYQIKQELDGIPVVINGNITTAQEVSHHQQYVDGVMVGRLACNNPYALAEMHDYLYPHLEMPSRLDILEQYIYYVANQLTKNTPLSILLKPLMNFAHGLPHSKHWKEYLLAAQQTKQLKPLLEAKAWLAQHFTLTS